MREVQSINDDKYIKIPKELDIIGLDLPTDKNLFSEMELYEAFQRAKVKDISFYWDYQNFLLSVGIIDRFNELFFEELAKEMENEIKG